MAKSKGRPSWFKMFFNQKALIDSVPPETAGIALKAAYAYFAGEDVPEMDQLAFAVFASIKPYIDDAFRDYEVSVTTGRIGGKKAKGALEGLRDPKGALGGVTDKEEDKEADKEEDKEAEERGRGRRTNAPAAPPTHSRAGFVPPTLEEVTAYVKERGSRVDPQGFIDFYEAKGWMVGKSAMKDWKAACRNAEHWERWEKRKDQVRIDADYDDGEDFLHGD